MRHLLLGLLKRSTRSLLLQPTARTVPTFRLPISPARYSTYPMSDSESSVDFVGDESESDGYVAPSKAKAAKVAKPAAPKKPSAAAAKPKVSSFNAHRAQLADETQAAASKKAPAKAPLGAKRTPNDSISEADEDEIQSVANAPAPGPSKSNSLAVPGDENAPSGSKAKSASDTYKMVSQSCFAMRYQADP